MLIIECNRHSIRSNIFLLQELRNKSLYFFIRTYKSFVLVCSCNISIVLTGKYIRFICLEACFFHKPVCPFLIEFSLGGSFTIGIILIYNLTYKTYLLIDILSRAEIRKIFIRVNIICKIIMFSRLFVTSTHCIVICCRQLILFISYNIGVLWRHHIRHLHLNLCR